MLYYFFYKLLKHAGQGLFEKELALQKIDSLYGRRKFTLMFPLFRIYTLLLWFIRASAEWKGLK